MGDLDANIDENYLIQLYQSLGFQVASVRLIKDRITSKPQGYCFLEFESEQIAQQVLTTLNLKQWPGTDKLIKLNWASASSRGTREEYSVYVGDLSPEVDDNALFKFFATRLTSCKSAKVVTEQGGGSKGFGFVRFTTDEDSKKAISNYNLSSGLGQNRIRVCKAFPKQGDRNMNPSSDPWQQYQQQMSAYNQNIAQIQQQYTEATDVEPYDDGLTVEQLNREYIDNDKEFFDLLESTKWQYFDSVLATRPTEATS